MLILSQTTDKIQVVLESNVTTNQLQVKSSFRDITSSTYVPNRTLVNTDNTSDVDIVGSPASDTQRVVDHINIYNKDTVSAVVTVKFDANGVEYILWKGTLLSGATLTYLDGAGWNTSSGDNGYAINVQALTSSPTDGQTVYFGTLPKAPVTSAAASKVFIPKSSVIKRAEIYCYSGTAGTNEAWSLYVRIKNTTDYLIQTVAVSAAERIFTNSSMNIPVNAGDYFEIKGVQPTWATNPATTIYGGYLYLE